MYYATNQKREVFAFTTSGARDMFVTDCVTLDTWAINREKAVAMMKSYIVNRAASLTLDQFREIYKLTLTASEKSLLTAYNIIRE